jgi:DNA-binding GntR family transcriptional regulator
MGVDVTEAVGQGPAEAPARAAQDAKLSFELDRSSPVPLYYQVSRQIEAAIVRGELAAGTRLENEAGMAQRLGLSRPTMRRAIQELVDKGLVVRKRGIGTQVVGHRGEVRRQLQLTSLFEDLARSGQNPTTKVLMHELTTADETVAHELNITSGANVVHLVRLRYADGEPLALMRNWLPVEVASSFTVEQLEAGGLYGLFRASGIHTRIASQRIGARLATTDEAGPLQVRKGAPLLTAERTTYDDNGRAVEFGRHIYRADKYSFEVMVVER